MKLKTLCSDERVPVILTRHEDKLKEDVLYISDALTPITHEITDTPKGYKVVVSTIELT